MIGSALCGLAQGPAQLVVGRVLLGLSGAMIMPATLALVNAYYPGPARARALSFWSIASWGGSGLASVFGGAMTTFVGWRWIFFLSIPVALIALLLIRGTPESKVEGEHERFDLAGLVLMVLGLVALNVTINNGSDWGWTSALTLGGFALAVVMLVAFVLYEARAASPLIDLSLFRNRPYDGATISNFMLNFAAAGAVYMFLVYTQKARGLSSFEAGLLTLAYTIATLICIRIGERLGRTRGARMPMAVGCLLSGIGIFAVAQTFVQGAAYYLLAAMGLAVMGVGLGVSATPSTDTAVRGAPPERVGVASGLYKMASSLGSSVGLAISGAIFASVLAADSSAIDRAAMLAVFASVVACAVAVIVVLLAVPRQTTVAPREGHEHHHVGTSHGRAGVGV